MTISCGRGSSLAQSMARWAELSSGRGLTCTPDIPARLAPPGVFYRHYGRRDAITFCVGHFIFGAVAATVYVVINPGLPVSAAL